MSTPEPLPIIVPVDGGTISLQEYPPNEFGQPQCAVVLHSHCGGITLTLLVDPDAAGRIGASLEAWKLEARSRK